MDWKIKQDAIYLSEIVIDLFPDTIIHASIAATTNNRSIQLLSICCRMLLTKFRLETSYSSITTTEAKKCTVPGKPYSVLIN